MKLECTKGSGENQLVVKLFGYSAAELKRLQGLADQLAEGLRGEVAVHELEWVQPQGRCELIFLAGKDRPIEPPVAGQPIVLELSSTGWADVHQKLKGLASSSGFQWVGPAGDVRVLVSADGRW